MGDWDEGAHPRDENGRFGSGGGGSKELKAFAKQGRKSKVAKVKQSSADEQSSKADAATDDARKTARKAEMMEAGGNASKEQLVRAYQGVVKAYGNAQNAHGDAARSLREVETNSYDNKGNRSREGREAGAKATRHERMEDNLREARMRYDDKVARLSRPR